MELFMTQGIGGILLAFIIIALYVGILIFILDAVRRLVRAVEKIAVQTSKQAEILSTLVDVLSARNVNTRQDT